MRGDTKGFGRPKKGSPDLRERAGRLDLRADSEIDATLLSMLYQVMFNVNVNDHPRAVSNSTGTYADR